MVRVFVYGGLMSMPAIRHKGVAAKLADHCICFTVKGAVCWEPSFAELKECIGKEAWGVMAELTIDEWHWLRRHEISYCEKKVLVQTKDQQFHECIALVQKNSNDMQELNPSARYARLLYHGATSFNFPEEIINHYQTLYNKGNRVTLYTRWMMPCIKFLIPHVGPKRAFYTCFLGFPIIIIALLLLIWWLLK